MKNPLSIEAFADWCDKQPADEVFDLGDPDRCAVGQYAQYLGFERASFDFGIVTSDGSELPIRGLDDSIMWGLSERSPIKFGTLAARLRAA